MTNFGEDMMSRGVGSSFYQHKFRKGKEEILGVYAPINITNENEVFTKLYHEDGNVWVQAKFLDIKECLWDQRATKEQVEKIKSIDGSVFEEANSFF